MLARVALLVTGVWAVIPTDRVSHFPGQTTSLPSPFYSGYLRGEADNQTFYTHYTLTLSQRDPEVDPLVLWQQGSASSFGLGFLTEVGPYLLDRSSLQRNATLPTASRNRHSWDRISNLVTFEHPPGVGFSYCVDANEERIACHWNDESQAEAFYATLEAFYASHHEFSSNEFFIFGESYAGLYVPYLVREIVRRPTSVAAKQLQAFAIGNGCTGTHGATPGDRGTCNGPGGPMGMPIARCGATEHVVEFLSSHAAISRERKASIDAACGFPCVPANWGDVCGNFSSVCQQELQLTSDVIGYVYMYNFYDTCGSGNEIESTQGSAAMGGQPYPCGTGDAVAAFCNNEEVRKALHLKPIEFYGGHLWVANAFGNDWSMVYPTFSGCSYDLYPELLQHYSAIIYNGDFDLCVPWTQNVAWTTKLAQSEGYNQSISWQPWPNRLIPAGYVSVHNATSDTSLSLVTFKGAGHMVPMYQPENAFEFFTRVLSKLSLVS